MGGVRFGFFRRIIFLGLLAFAPLSFASLSTPLFTSHTTPRVVLVAGDFSYFVADQTLIRSSSRGGTEILVGAVLALRVSPDKKHILCVSLFEGSAHQVSLLSLNGDQIKYQDVPIVGDVVDFEFIKGSRPAFSIISLIESKKIVTTFDLALNKISEFEPPGSYQSILPTGHLMGYGFDHLISLFDQSEVGRFKSDTDTYVTSDNWMVTAGPGFIQLMDFSRTPNLVYSAPEEGRIQLIDPDEKSGSVLYIKDRTTLMKAQMGTYPGVLSIAEKPITDVFVVSGFVHYISGEKTFVVQPARNAQPAFTRAVTKVNAENLLFPRFIASASSKIAIAGSPSQAPNEFQSVILVYDMRTDTLLKTQGSPHFDLNHIVLDSSLQKPAVVFLNESEDVVVCDTFGHQKKSGTSVSEVLQDGETFYILTGRNRETMTIYRANIQELCE